MKKIYWILGVALLVVVGLFFRGWKIDKGFTNPPKEFDDISLKELESFYGEKIDKFADSNDLILEKLELARNDNSINRNTKMRVYNNISLEANLKLNKDESNFKDYDQYLKDTINKLSTYITSQENEPYSNKIGTMNIILKDSNDEKVMEMPIFLSASNIIGKNTEEEEFIRLKNLIYDEIDRYKNWDLIELGRNEEEDEPAQYKISINMLNGKGKLDKDNYKGFKDLSDRIYEQIAKEKDLMDYIRSFDVEEIVIKYNGFYNKEGINEDYIYKL